MYIEILTPEKLLYQGDALRVQLPGSKGSFEILNNHAPIISSLTEGFIHIADAKGNTKIHIQDGFIECQQNKVVVLTGQGEVVS